MALWRTGRWICLFECRRCRRCEHEQPTRVHREGDETERLIEVERAVVLRFNHDSKDGQILSNVYNPMQGIGYQNLTDTFAPRLFVPGKPTDHRSEEHTSQLQPL